MYKCTMALISQVKGQRRGWINAIVSLFCPFCVQKTVEIKSLSHFHREGKSSKVEMRLYLPNETMLGREIYQKVVKA